MGNGVGKFAIILLRTRATIYMMARSLILNLGSGDEYFISPKPGGSCHQNIIYRKFSRHSIVMISWPVCFVV